MAQRVGRPVVVGMPVGGPPVQLTTFGLVETGQFLAEYVGKQRVWPEPGRFTVVAVQEAAVPGQPGQQLTGVGAAGQRVGQVGADRPAEGAATQQFPGRRRQLCQHLGAQVRGHVRVITAEPLRPPARVGLPPGGQGGEPQTCRPTACAFPQPGDRSGRQRHPVRHQQVGHLVGGEGQVVGADLGQFTGQPQPVQGGWQTGPGGGYQPQPPVGVP